jgi:hypothetical protein
LTSKNTSNVRFILRVLLWRSSRPTARASPASRSAAERRQVQARVGRFFTHCIFHIGYTEQICSLTVCMVFSEQTLSSLGCLPIVLLLLRS